MKQAISLLEQGFSGIVEEAAGAEGPERPGKEEDREGDFPLSGLGQSEPFGKYDQISPSSVSLPLLPKPLSILKTVEESCSGGDCYYVIEDGAGVAVLEVLQEVLERVTGNKEHEIHQVTID